MQKPLNAPFAHKDMKLLAELSYLVGGHVTDWAVGLYCLQLIQTPVQLLHGLHSQCLVGLICQQTHGHVFRPKWIHVHRGAPWHHVRGSKRPCVAWSYGGRARWTSRWCRGSGGGVNADLLHLIAHSTTTSKASAWSYFRQTRAKVTVCVHTLSLSLYSLFQCVASFPLLSCTLQTPSHSVWLPRPLAGPLKFLSGVSEPLCWMSSMQTKRSAASCCWCVCDPPNTLKSWGQKKKKLGK